MEYYIYTRDCFLFGETLQWMEHLLILWGYKMIRLSDKVRLIFALLGASSILASMYLIPFIKTENQFWEILLFILGVLLIGIALLNSPKN